VDKNAVIPAHKKGFIISEYISNPHIIDEKKYDLRIYVLVTSFNPLTIYIYEDGLVRFATVKYSLDPDSMDNKFVHLTNYSINKKNEDYVQNKAKGDDSTNTSKWSLKTLEKVFIHSGKDWKKVKEGIHDVIIKELITVEDPFV
jgi:tubulin polyglutamylase TTLL4